jgi:enoyl-CoA hydratase/carnithine racemase
MIEGFATIEKPTIALIDGVAAGAGIALALACDWRIATARTRLTYREGRLGLLATHGGCVRLVKLLGLARAQEVMLGGDELDGEAARRLGLVSELAPADGAAAAHNRAKKMLERSPLSYGNAKRVLALAADVDSRSGMLGEALAQAALLLSDDHAEGLAAVAEHRAPTFAAR